MKKLFSAALCALATLVLSVAQGETFFLLRHDAWTNFGDSSGWGVGTTTEATNPQGLVPGEGDYLFCYQSAGAGTYGWSYYFDLTATED
ncbi:MAG: hypothetical protein PUK76_05165, partial [Treponema sp.]|nr:hypothetical protein [Treponema sp.]